MKPDKRSSRPRPTPEDVLAGRARLGARDLIALIREVNPSGLDLHAKEMARRYELKSRLQGLLIRRFASELSVRPEPGQPGVVMLHHRVSGLEACHAVMDALDDDARSWIRREIDLASFGAPDAPQTAPQQPVPRRRPAMGREAGDTDALSIGELISAGREAMDAYDYDLARARLSTAFERSGGTADVAAPLLALLVDYLAADRDALDLESRLDPEALHSAPIRLLLAVASARCSERARALRLVKPLADPRAADVFVALARAAMDAGHPDQAGRDLIEARKLDPARGDLVGLEEAIERLRAAERRPWEEELERLAAAGRYDEAASRASAILSRWPNSEIARRTLRTIDEARKADQTAQLTAAAEAALSQGELSVALSLFRQALAISGGEAGSRLGERAAEVAALEEARIDRAAADAVMARLRAADPTAGLLDYVALKDKPRADVRRACALPQLVRLDELGIRGPGAVARAGVHAVAALVRAEELVNLDPEGALRLLAPHRKVLDGYPPAIEINVLARRALDTRKREAARGRFERARAAFEAGEEERAHKLLSDTSLDALPDDERDAAEQLRTRIASRAEFRIWADRLDAMLIAGDVLKARDAVEELSPRAGDNLRAHYLTSVRATIKDKISELFRVRVLEEATSTSPSPERVTAELIGLSAMRGAQRLLLGGHAMFLAETRSSWVFVRIIDLATCCVSKRVILRTSEPMYMLGDDCAEGRLFVFGQQGFVLAISLEDFAVTSWFKPWSAPRETSAPDGLPSIFLVEEATLAPGGRFLWLVCYEEGSRTVRVVDLERRRVVRELADPGGQLFLRPTIGRVEPRIVAVKKDVAEVTFYDVQGTIAPVRDLALPLVADSITVHPDRVRLFALVGGRPGGGDASAAGGWVEFTPGAAPPAVHAIDGLADGIDPKGRCAAATSFDEGLVFALVSTHGGERHLLAFRPQSSPPAGQPPLATSLELVYRVPVPDQTALIQDAGGRRVAALAPRGEGVDLVELGGSPPSFHPGPARAPFNIPRFASITNECHRPTGERLRGVLSLAATLRGDRGRARESRIASAMHARGPERMIDLAHALEIVGQPGEATKVAITASKQFPDHAEIRLYSARLFANSGTEWQNVRDILTSTDPRGLDEGGVQHLHHLLGCAYLMLDDPDEALRVLREGAAIAGGRCDLGPLTALATPLPDGPDMADAWTSSEGPLLELRVSMRRADACLSVGDASGARRAMPERLVLEAEEVQSMARLVEGYLGDEPEHPGGRFNMAFALAQYCDLNREKTLWLRRELPFPGARWDAARLDAIEARAMAWLEATFG